MRGPMRIGELLEGMQDCLSVQCTKVLACTGHKVKANSYKEQNMIHDIRIYDLKPRAVPEYWKRFSAKLDGRLEFSPLGGHWYTEVGLLNQMVAIWPYEDLEERADIRCRAEAGPNPKWPPDTGDLIISMKSEIYIPAYFMEPIGKRDIGPFYEMRIYSYPQEFVPQILDEWSQVTNEREKLSPLAGCWYSEFGGGNNFIHMWAYRSFEERLRIRQQALDQGCPPPSVEIAPTRQENKLLFPAPFSPMQ